MAFLGMEFGGTKLQAALGDGLGNLYREVKVLARPEAGREGICKQMDDLVYKLMREGQVYVRGLEGAGIGFGGPVDVKTGRTVTSHQVSGWDDFPILDWAEEFCGVRPVLGNDSDLAGWAEARFGSGVGYSPMVYMNIGSGIGGALVIDGQLYRGQGKGAAEFGHMRLLPGLPGAPWRTLESFCSGWNLILAARQAAATNPKSLMWEIANGKLDDIDVAVAMKAYLRDDPTAQRFFQECVGYLGVAIANIFTMLHPACFVLGGGVAQLGELLLAPLRAEVRRQVFAPFADSCPIFPAKLGEYVVLHGALALAREHALK